MKYILLFHKWENCTVIQNLSHFHYSVFGPRGGKWFVYIYCPLLWILEILTLYLPFLSVFMIERYIFTFACCCCIPHLCSPQKLVNVQGCWKDDSVLWLCSYFDLCWLPFILVVRQSWRIERRNLVAWRLKIVSGLFYWMSLWAWWGGRWHVPESFPLQFWAEGPEERNCMKKPWFSVRKQRCVGTHVGLGHSAFSWLLPCRLEQPPTWHKFDVSFC